jgi:hypothetical protein
LSTFVTDKLKTASGHQQLPFYQSTLKWKELLIASSGPLGFTRRRSAFYSNHVGVDPAFLNDGLNGTCKVWIGYEVFIVHPANHRSSR